MSLQSNLHELKSPSAMGPDFPLPRPGVIPAVGAPTFCLAEGHSSSEGSGAPPGLVIGPLEPPIPPPSLPLSRAVPFFLSRNIQETGSVSGKITRKISRKTLREDD